MGFDADNLHTAVTQKRVKGRFLMPLDPFILAHTAVFAFKPNGDSRAFSSAVTTSGTTSR